MFQPPTVLLPHVYTPGSVQLQLSSKTKSPLKWFNASNNNNFFLNDLFATFVRYFDFLFLVLVHTSLSLSSTHPVPLPPKFGYFRRERSAKFASRENYIFLYCLPYFRVPYFLVLSCCFFASSLFIIFLFHSHFQWYPKTSRSISLWYDSIVANSPQVKQLIFLLYFA